MTAAEGIVMALQVWVWIGAAVALVFLTVGIDRIDEDARGAYPFRVLLVPGVLLIWPLILWRWAVLETGRDRPLARHRPPRKAHRVIAPILLAVIALTLITGFAVRPNWSVDTPPVQLQEAGG